MWTPSEFELLCAAGFWSGRRCVSIEQDENSGSPAMIPAGCESFIHNETAPGLLPKPQHNNSTPKTDNPDKSDI